MRLTILCNRRDYEMMSIRSSQNPSIVRVQCREAHADVSDWDMVILWNATEVDRGVEANLRRWSPSGQRTPILAVATEWPRHREPSKLILDRERFCARVGARELPLTPTQFVILEYLVHNQDCWQLPGTIMRDALGTCEPMDTSRVRFHICKLRSALGEYSEAAIRWQRGKGYMFTQL